MGAVAHWSAVALQKRDDKKKGGRKRAGVQPARRLTTADRRPAVRSCGSSSCTAVRRIPAYYGIDSGATQMEDISFYFPLIAIFLLPAFLFAGGTIKQFSPRLEFRYVRQTHPAYDNFLSLIRDRLPVMKSLITIEIVPRSMSPTRISYDAS